MVPEEMVAWVILSGIGHALSGETHGWRHTACGVFTSPGPVVGRKTVKRVCRKCRRILRETILDPESRERLRTKVQERLKEGGDDGE